jgi:hypothetical protein
VIRHHQDQREVRREAYGESLELVAIILQAGNKVALANEGRFSAARRADQSRDLFRVHFSEISFKAWNAP